MDFDETLFWLQQGEERLRVLLSLTQPATCKQLATLLSKSAESVMKHLRQMRIYGLIMCLNPQAGQSRLYWLTSSGVDYQRNLAQIHGKSVIHFVPALDWSLYGNVCFSHRRTVLLSLQGKMQPPQVKRRALASNPRLRMSVDNCRLVLKWLANRGVIRAVRPRGASFVFYQLTEVGRTCQQLLRKVTSPGAR